MNTVTEIDVKIKTAMEICRKRNVYSPDDPFTRMYPFTTENIAGYMPFFALENKTLLTVGSSGDQALNAILNGSKLIQIYDVCPFVKEYVNLKKAAIIVLNREEFIKFFHRSGILGRMVGADYMLFDEDTYAKLREVMDLESGYFWDELFKKYNPSLVRNRLFRLDEYSANLIKEINPYLSNDVSYNVLKGKINEACIEFVHNDIFGANVDGSFDNIFLSNIAGYYHRSEIKSLFDKLLPNLTDGGKILIAYLYNTDLEEQYFSSNEDIYDLFSTLEVFPKGTTVNSFIGVSGIRSYAPHMKDSVLCYRKVKK